MKPNQPTTKEKIEYDPWGNIVKKVSIPKPKCKGCGRSGIALNDHLFCIPCYFRLDKKHL